MSKTIIGLLALLAIQLAAAAETITLSEALNRAHEQSPELKAARLQTQATERQIAASGLRQNPKLEVEAEGIEDDDLSPGEYTVKLKQEFQLGGKRRKERAVALKAADVSGQTEHKKAIELDTEVRKVFIELMTQQEVEKVRSEQEELGRAFIEVAKRRLDAGGGSELEVVQAELALEEIKLAQSCCLGDLQAEQEKLASLLNVDFNDLPTASGDYYGLEKIEGLTLSEQLPALQKLNAQAEQFRAMAAQSKASDTPNVTLGAGFKHEADEDLNTFLVSASIPLNFSRRGRIDQATNLLRAEAAEAAQENTRRKLQAELNSLLALYNGTLIQVDLCKNQLIPKAEQAYELSRKGYEAGRFSWLELIEAQQNLAETRLTLIETLREAHLLRAELAKFMNEGL